MSTVTDLPNGAHVLLVSGGVAALEALLAQIERLAFVVPAGYS